jgi:DNA-binding response OmpR family regulator
MTSSGSAASTIVVVVIDQDVRNLLRHMLERAGFHVLTAADEAEAWTVAGTAAIDLLLCEVGPGIRGRSIVDRLRARKPGLPVLFLTGWFDHPSFAELNGEAILKKPFSREQLIHAVENVFQRESGASCP